MKEERRRRSSEERLILRGLGTEIQAARVERGLSRVQMASELPNQLVDRTLLSYEHGPRAMSIGRFVEICLVLGVSPAKVITKVMINAGKPETVGVRVHLGALLASDDSRFLHLRRWAMKQVEAGRPYGLVEPRAIQIFADVIGCDAHELAMALAELPDEDATSAEWETRGGGS